MKINLEIDAEHFAIAEKMAKELGYEDSKHYLNTILTAAVLNDRDDFVFRFENEEPERMFEEDEGGGMRLRRDLDDDIPF